MNHRVLKEAIKIFGVDAQLEKAKEELEELIEAISDYQQSNKDESLVCHICEETADVKIMVKQLDIIFEGKCLTNWEEFKIQRLKTRLDRIKKT